MKLKLKEKFTPLEKAVGGIFRLPQLSWNRWLFNKARGSLTGFIGILGKILSPKTFFLGVLAIFAVSQIAFFAFPSESRAQNKDINLNDVTIRFDSFVNNQPNPDNYVKVVNGKSFSINGTLRLLKPDSLHFDSDNIAYENALDGEVVAAGFGVTPFDTSKVCRQLDNSRIVYLYCDFVAKTAPNKQQDVVQKGSWDGSPLPLSSNVALIYRAPAPVVVRPESFASLGITTPSKQGTRYKIYVYPYLMLSNGSLPISRDGSATISFPGGGKELYIDYFDSQPDADAAPARPADGSVPGYGGTATGPNTSAGSSPISKFINDLITGIASFIIQQVFNLFTILVAPLLQGFLSVRVHTDVFVNVIYPGWEVLRNVCNIYFIVAIIAIALGTLFRVESYKFKDLLVQLMIAALTVNFSLVIAQAVLGVADTLQNQFLPNNQQVIGQLAKDLMPANIKEILDKNLLAKDSVFATAGTSLFLMSMSVGAFLVFCAILIFLLIRIVALWILLMLSPLAYAAGVLPSTSSMRKKWWDEFIKYAFFTAIMGFFMNMAAIISSNYKYVFADISTNMINNTFTVLILAVASNVLLLVFLIAALKIASDMGIFFADKVTEIAKKGMFMPFKGAAAIGVVGGKGAKWVGKDWAGGWIQKKYNEGTAKLAEGGKLKKALFAGLHIPSTVRAFRKDSSENLQRSKDLTAAAALSVKRQVPGFRRKGEDPLALYNEHKGKELLEERRGETSDSEQDEVKFALKLYEDAAKGDKDAQLMLPEQLRRMFKNHNMNEFVEQFAIEVGITDKNGVKKRIGSQDDKKVRYNRDSLRGVMNELERMGSITHTVNEEYQKRLGTLGYASDDLTGNELTYTDDTGKAHLIDVEFNPTALSYEVVGQKDYSDLHEYAQNDPSVTNDLTLRAMIKSLESGSGSDYSSFKAAHPDFDMKRYKNARQDRSKIAERNINLSKKLEMPQMQQWWESMVSHDSSGNIVFGGSGAHIFTHMTTGKEFLGTRGQPSGRVTEFYLPFVKDRTQFRKELKRVIKEKAFVDGRKIQNIDLEVDKQEYDNLRMVALIEKDIDLVTVKKFDLIDPATATTTRAALAPSDPRYASELVKHITDLRAILKK